MRGWRHLLPLLGAAALFTTANAAAANPSARLVYSRTAGAEGCPDETQLRASVARRVGYDPFFPYAPRTVVVTIGPSTASPVHLTSKVELVDSEARSAGSRGLTSMTDGCDELFEATALAIAIAIDPQALVGPQPTPPDPPRKPPELPPEPGPEVPLPQAPPPDVGERTSSPLRLRLQLALRGAVGAQPNLAPGAVGGGSLVGRRASLGLELGAHLPTETSVPTGGNAEAWLMAGSVVPCVRLVPLSLCGVVSVGRFEGSGVGVTAPLREAALFFAAGVRPGVELVVSGPLRAHIDAEILGNFARTTMAVGRDDVWKASAILGAASVGLSWEIGGQTPVSSRTSAVRAAPSSTPTIRVTDRPTRDQ